MQDDFDDQGKARRAEDLHDQQLVRYLRQIGADSLASELSDLRFRNRVLESQRNLNEAEGWLAFEQQLQERIEEKTLAIQSQFFDRSQAYLNFLITAGYAGLFAIWNFVRSYMPAWDMKLIALLLGVSILTFVTWTIVQMIVTAKAAHRMSSVIIDDHDRRESKLEAIENQEHRNRVKLARVQRYWFPTFVFTVLTGFLAALLLLFLLLLHVLGMQVSLIDAFNSMRP